MKQLLLAVWHFMCTCLPEADHMCRADYVTLQYAESVVKKYAEAKIPLEVFGTLKDAWQNKWVPYTLSAYSFNSCANFAGASFVSLLERAQIYGACATDSRACTHRETFVLSDNYPEGPFQAFVRQLHSNGQRWVRMS